MEFRDLQAQYQRYKSDIDTAIEQTLQKGQFIGGSEVTRLEERLAEYVGVKHCITCANGTEAMTLVLSAWDIGAGDAVFVPDFTFFATAEVAAYRGATPIFVDVDKDTYNLDPFKLEEAIAKVSQEGLFDPKAIIPVDLFGLPADYDRILPVARKYGLRVLEDGAQGFGGSIRGKRACSFGEAATTSFFPAKPLGCYGDGGAIFTNDEELSELLRSYKVHGKGLDKYDNVRIGVNSRLDTIQAAILNVKLTAFIEHELADVNRVYRLYTERLQGMVATPLVPEGFISSFAQYTIRINSRPERDALQKKLKNEGIPSMVYYSKPMHKQTAFAHLKYISSDFPVSSELCETVLSLPMHPYLSEAEVEKICNAII